MATESGGCSSCGDPVTDGGRAMSGSSPRTAAVDQDCGHTVSIVEGGGGGGGGGLPLDLRTLAIIGTGVVSGTVAVKTR